jgi:hypothetical protein
MIVFVNFASQWSESWEQAATKASSTCWKASWYTLIWLLSGFILALTAFCFYLMGIIFVDTPSGATESKLDISDSIQEWQIDISNCEINKWFIVASGIACVFLLLISLRKFRLSCKFAELSYLSYSSAFSEGHSAQLSSSSAPLLAQL